MVSSLFNNQTATRRCVTFWYYLEGVDAGALSVAQENYGFPDDVILWRLDSTQGALWTYGQVPVSQDYDYRVVFIGEVGASTTGNIAVDDITVTDNNCPAIPNSAIAQPTFPPSSQLPTTAPHIVIPAGPANCDFEGGLCSFGQDSGDDFDWTRKSGPTDTANTGPDDDHTHAGSFTISGSYMYTEADSTSIGQSARLRSALYSPVTSDSCLTFWYHMHGEQIGIINVLTASGSAETLAWTRAGTQGDQWLVARVPVTGTTPFNVIFEGIMSGDPRCDMAVDDILLENEDCLAITPSPGAFSPVCDFEYGYAVCGYNQESLLDDFDWSLGSGPTDTALTGPSADHTTNAINGKYMYIETEAPRVQGERAWLYSHTFPATGSHCFEFYYHMYGDNIGSLNVLVEVGGLFSQPYFTLSGNLGNQWNVARIPFSINDDFQVYFEATVGDGVLGNIAVDDIDMYAGSCPPPGDCDFENGFCTWNNDPTSDAFDWIIGQGGTPSVNTGPSIDHTLGTVQGSYVFMETSSPVVPGDTVRFRSQAFGGTPSGGRCLRFWYHMFGTQIGSLNVYVETIEGAVRSDGWSYGVDLGDRWNSGQMPVESPDSYVVVFEGVVGLGFEGDIALDDISFVDSTCGVQPPAADVRPTTTAQPYTGTGTQPVPTTVAPSPICGCDFDLDLCTFTQAITDDIDWTRLSGNTPSTYTGPENDHTIGTAAGFYIYTEASSFFNQVAVLESEFILATSGRMCADFWYHMWGADMGTLNVYAQTGTTPGQFLWTQSGALSRSWFEPQMIFIPTADLKFVFEGVTGSNFDSDIALDDIFITTGACRGYHTCTFEDASICGYSQGNLDDFDWSWNAGTTPTLYTGPSVDATTRTASGHYMYIDAAGQQPGEKATILTPYFDPSDAGQDDTCWTFYYHMFGDQMGALNVMLEGDTVPLWTQSAADLGDTWFFAVVNVSSSAVFRLVFEGVVGAGPRSDLAIDDVDYTLGPCGSIGSCDFENGMCMWSNIDADSFDWLRYQSSTPSTGTGPNVDHTLGTSSGHYMFVETSPQIAGEQAVLFLGAPSLTGQRCLSFWYMMFGVDTGELVVYTSMGSGSLSREVLWMLAGQQNIDQQTWLNGQVTVDFDTVDEIYIAAILTTVPYGDTAIDDIDIAEGACDIQPTYAEPNTLTGSASCNFDGDLCSYVQDVADDFNWARITGATTSTNTGPSNDHTSGSGFYVYIESSSPRLPGEKARLVSTLQNATTSGGRCLEFYYHMYGATMGALNVNVLDESGSETTIFTKGLRDYGNRWLLSSINIDSGGSNFKVGIKPLSISWNIAFIPILLIVLSMQIVFEGIIGSSFESDIAIDDIKYYNGICPPSRTCDFEASDCSWKQEAVLDDFDWVRGKASEVPSGSLYNDHTTGTPAGNVLFANTTSERAPGDQALIYSPSYDATEEGDCMTFWYHIHNDPNEGYLAVWESINGALYGPYWTSTVGVTSNDWQFASVTLKSNATFQVVLQAVVGVTTAADMLVDDITFEYGACAPPGFCDFESDYCYWTNTRTGDNFDWTLSSGATPSVTTGPSKDHTLSSSSGHYVFIETSTLVAGDKAWLISEFSPPSDGCFTFWYHMYGAGVGELNVYLIDGVNGNMALEWSESGNHGDRWVKGQVSTSNLNPYQIAIEATYGANYTGDIAIDDTFITVDGLCNESGEWDCDFEDDWCGYTQAQDDTFDWTRLTGATSSLDTGPSIDHTTATGYYVFIETSSPRVPGDEARFMSTLIPTTYRQCFTFYYHMFGPTVETLNVLTRRNDSAPGDIGNVVWSSQGEKGDVWYPGSVVIAEQVAFQVVFQAYVGASFTGDIAIDDIRIYPGDCPATPTCDFENSLLCGYRQDTTDNFDWTYGSGDTPTSLTGPSVDVTYGTAYGHYMYIEASQPSSPGAKARLIGPHISTDTTLTVCWSLYFHMYGQDVGTLNILTQNADATSTIVTSLAGDQGNQWYSTAFEITSNGYEIVFEGVVGSGEEGDIAIDNVRMIEGSCGGLLDCDFENNMFCQWSNAQSDEFDWIRVRGGTPSASTGPLYDHTIGATGSGHYVFIEGSSPQLPGDTAKLISPVYTTNDGVACFTFWINMYGTQIADLRLYKQDVSSGNTDPPELLWLLYGEQSTDQTHWIQGQVTLNGTFTLRLQRLTQIKLVKGSRVPSIAPSATGLRTSLTSSTGHYSVVPHLR
eukprot:XP_011661638.1 PREDICTED: MAM and LDL-receptor class A domain-containing protein 1-like [Strongylocentrotus purpuratus]